MPVEREISIVTTVGKAGKETETNGKHKDTCKDKYVRLLAEKKLGGRFKGGMVLGGGSLENESVSLFHFRTW